MSREAINFTCKKHCYKEFCAKPHTARLPDNRKEICTLKSKFLPLKHFPRASSLQQQHPPSSSSPRARSKGKNLPAFLFLSQTKSLCVTSTSSAEFAGRGLILSFRTIPENLLVLGCNHQLENQKLSRNKLGDTVLPADRQ